MIKKFLLFGVLLVILSFGYVSGSAIKEMQLQKERIKHEKLIKEARTALQNARDKHNAAQNEHLLTMERYRNAYAQAVDSIKSDFNDRLRDSEARGNLYRERASLAGAECRNLAEHAAQLDTALTEGRELVRELSADIKQYQLANTEITRYLIADRDHLNGK